MLRMFETGPLIFYGTILVAGFVISSIVRGLKGDGAKAMWTGLECGLLGAVGSLLSCSAVIAVLAAGGETEGAAIVAGFGMFLWLGPVNLISCWVSGEAAAGPGVLTWAALGIGGCVGMYAGIHRIYDWKGLGWLAFPLDVTWGLAGTTNACLIHLINTLWTTHASEQRRNAHRYSGGFRVKGNFAFTQGAVMSNMGSGPSAGGGPSLYRHEMVHVWQNRIFGPLFTLTYLMWMVLMLIPGLVAGLAVKTKSAGDGIMWWTYYDNPWEVWAYQSGGYRPNTTGWMHWPDGVVIGLAIFFYPAAVGLLIWPVWRIWFA